MTEKLKHLDMSFDEALTRLSKVPKRQNSNNAVEPVEKKEGLPNNKKRVSESPPHLVKKND